MTEELWWGVLVCATILLIVGGFTASYTHSRKLDAEAPVVETCIKHPVTVSPFKPNY